MYEQTLPEVGEFVIATVAKVTDYGSYVTLDEFGKIDGLLHISEISSSWVKNIRDFVRENQKLVLKVLRVDPEKKQVDLSLRRVTGKERQDKLLEWKRRRKAITILELAAAEINVDQKEFVTEALTRLEDRFDEAHAGLEELIEKGPESADRLKIPADWTASIVKIAQQKIKLPTVKIKSTLELTCPSADGVNTIKRVLSECKSLRRGRKTKTEIYTVGAPKYVVEVYAKDYKDAEKAIGGIAEYAVEEIQKAGGKGKIIRAT